MKRTLKTKLKVPEGYEIEDLYDTEDEGYEFCQAPMEETSYEKSSEKT